MSPIISRQQKSRSTVCVPRRALIDSPDTETTDKKSKLSRISLNFIPGHGKKYSTYDGSRSYFRVDPITTEGVTQWEDSTATTEKIENQPRSSDVRNRIKRDSKKSRPRSGSVSNFMLMNGPTDESTNTEVKIKTETSNIIAENSGSAPSSAPGSAPSSLRRKKNLIPKLPTSFGVGKLLSHLESVRHTSIVQRLSRSMNNLLEVNVANSEGKSDPNQMTGVQERPKAIAAKSEDVLAKPLASNMEKIDRKSPIPNIEVIDITPDHPSCLPETKQEVAIEEKKSDPPTQQPQPKQTPQEAPQEALQPTPQQQPKQQLKQQQPQKPEACANVEETDHTNDHCDDKKKDKKKVKDSTRRKSGLAMLRNFFYATKIGMKRKDSGDKDKLTVKDSPSRKTSKGSATSEKTSARTSLTIEDDIIPHSHPVDHQRKDQQPAGLVDTTVLPLIQRNNSIQSEGAVSIREEAFVAKSAYHYEARVIAIVEPEPTSPPVVKEEISSSPTAATSNNLLQDDCPVINDIVNNPTPISDELTVEKTSPVRKSVTFSDPITPEDIEVAELRPPLPIKTKVKSPSPGYDVPRSTPIPIPDAEKWDEVAKNPFENSSTKSKSGDCKNVPPDHPTPEVKLVRLVSEQYIQLSFDTGPTKNATVTDVSVNLRELNNKSGETERVSFARAETELVYEERVQPMSSE